MCHYVVMGWTKTQTSPQGVLQRSMEVQYHPALRMTTLGILFDVLLGTVLSAVAKDLSQAHYQGVGDWRRVRRMYRYIAMPSFRRLVQEVMSRSALLLAEKDLYNMTPHRERRQPHAPSKFSEPQHPPLYFAPLPNKQQLSLTRLPIYVCFRCNSSEDPARCASDAVPLPSLGSRKHTIRDDHRHREFSRSLGQTYQATSHWLRRASDSNNGLD